MKNVRAVYRKLKEVKYTHLTTLYKKYLRRSSQNCKYNYKHIFLDSDGERREIHLCLFNQNVEELDKGLDPFLVDLCQEPKQFQNCNAFVLKYSKEDVKKIFEELLKDQNIKSKKYPEICALEWVLDKHSLNIKEMGLLEKINYHIKNFLKRGQHECHKDRAM